MTPVQLVHAHREHLTEDEGRGGKATPGTRKGQAARQIKRESDPTDRTTTFPVHYHSEVSKRLTSCSTSARGVEKRVHGTATRPLPSPERPAIPGHSLSVATSPRRPRTKANPAPRSHHPNETPADPARTRLILGCRARGLQARNATGRLSPFDHKTGKGHVPFFHGGDYYDARFNKRNQVVPLLVEALGGIGRRGARCLRFFARRAPCRKQGRDGTK